MNPFLLFLLPAIIMFGVLYLCKKYNFSIVPQEMKIKSPVKFEIPKVRRNEYGWHA